METVWEERWRDGPPVGAARSEIIRAFLPLVRAIARGFKARLPPSVEFDDLVSSGTLGLIAAVDRFDPDKGYNFKRYAAIRIRGMILDELRQLDWAPRSVRRDQGQVGSARRELESELGRRADSTEIAERLGLNPDNYARLARRIAPRSILRFEDLGINSDSDRRSILAFISDPASPDPMEQSVLKDACERLVECVDQLKERHRQVISLYYFENLNLKEIASIFGVTESRISQIHSAAIAVLKKKLAVR